MKVLENALVIAVGPDCTMHSFFGVGIHRRKINLLERAGHGKTEEILELLKYYGLKLDATVSTPCG